MTEKELFFRYLGLPSFSPLGTEIVKSEGVFLWDPQGKDYMDLVAGITVSNVGHRHPAVLAAIRDQLDRYLHVNVYGEFIQAPQVRFAERLVSVLPSTLDAVYFVNSGSEAIEGALKLAKRFTGRTGIISFRDAYHGSTHGALSILGSEWLKNSFRPLLPDTGIIDYNHIQSLERITRGTACVVVETVQAEAGVVKAMPEFMSALVSRCNETGTLIMVDDVQMGMGRTGRMFSFEHYGFVPDILVLAKALGGGMPVGAFVSSRSMMNSLAFDPELGHITTFGGHPVSCAAGLAALEILCNGDLLNRAEEYGRLIEETLSGHPALAAIRRAGLALGLDLRDPGKRNTFQQAALDAGVIIDWYLFKPACFRVAPPLTITREEVVEACRRVKQALDVITP